jgi:hypothetical protein
MSMALADMDRALAVRSGRVAVMLSDMDEALAVQAGHMKAGGTFDVRMVLVQHLPYQVHCFSQKTQRVRWGQTGAGEMFVVYAAASQHLPFRMFCP